MLHIVDATEYSVHGWTHGPELENARLLMKEKKTYLETKGLKATPYVEAITSGTMHQRILEIAEREKVSLIIMGTHQKTTFDTLVHGSVSYDLLHHMNSHVLVMRQNVPECPGGKTREETCPHFFTKLLVPVDFTEISRQMIAFIREIKGNGELVLLHIVTEGESGQEIEQNITHAHEELAKIQNELERTGFKVTTHVRVRNPVENIVSLADEEEVSLILMCAHKKNWISEFLQGSTTFSVVRTAKKPVLVLQVE